MLLRTFCTSSNNAVTAVVTKEVYKKLEERKELLTECKKRGLPIPQLPSIVPIFTFSDPQHPSFIFLTGSLEIMAKLLEGHNVIDRDFWVPFSNRTEWHYRDDPKTAEYEWRFGTSLDEAFEAFGLVMPE